MKCMKCELDIAWLRVTVTNSQLNHELNTNNEWDGYENVNLIRKLSATLYNTR
jgi:hypothetical protein